MAILVFINCDKSKTKEVNSTVSKDDLENGNGISESVKPGVKASVRKLEFNFNKITNLEHLEFNSNKDLKSLLQKTPIDIQSLNKDFQNSILTSKKGETWEGFDFKVFSLGKIESDKAYFWIVAKDIQGLDGEMTEFFVVQFDNNYKPKEFVHLGNSGSYAECSESSEFIINSENLSSKHYRDCFEGFDPEKEVHLTNRRQVNTNFDLTKIITLKKDTLNKIVEEK